MEKKQLFDIEKEGKAVLLQFYLDTRDQLKIELSKVQAKIDELTGPPKRSIGPQLPLVPNIEIQTETLPNF